ncbi:MAG TPA: IS1634 family transposase [Candidatus Saccharimonadales bacterium]|nr:IS1634 family transposase [Candidatus Saccharimonadales bacterium]
MFARLQRIKRPNGQIDQYVQIVESYWEGGKARQKIIANLGNKRVLESQLPSLLKILNPSLLKHSEFIEPKVALPYGGIFVVNRLFSELGLWKIFDGLSSSRGFADRVALLVANRLTAPSSEHALGGWLETLYAVDRRGERFLPVWKRQGRVKVDLGWLKQFYRVLDILIAHKERIEKELYLELRDLFHLRVEMVFYDLTSTYFEGKGPPPIARYGYSRDGRPRNRQVLVGVVMVKGLPLAHHVFSGDLLDHETVKEIVEDVGKRFELERVVLVGDRGMVTAKTLSLLKERGQGYLVGLVRRRREEVVRYIEAATGAGRECLSGITVSEKSDGPRTWVWEVKGEEQGVRVFVVHSEEREAYERAMRERSQERARKELEALKEQVLKGKLKSREKMGFHVAKIISRNQGHRYFDWRVTEKGEFEYFDHPIYLEREKKIEGKYLIQTEEKDIDAVEAVRQYKELSEVERGFRSLKDVLEMRPIYHHKESRVKAHIFVAALAFLLERVLERKLKEAGTHLSVTEAWQALRTIGVVEFDVGGGSKVGVTPGSARAREVLRALGVSKAELPQRSGSGKRAA